MKIDLGYEILEVYNKPNEIPKEELESGKKIKINRIKRNDKEYINYIEVKNGIIHNSQEEVKEVE